MSQASQVRVLWVTFDFPPRLSSGVFRPVKIYKYVDKTRLSIDFITHGEAGRFHRAVLDDSLLGDVSPAPTVRRVPTPILHDLLPPMAARFRRWLARSPGVGAASAVAPVTPPDGRRSGEGRTGSSLYRRLAMALYVPDHLFLWGYLATFTALWMHLTRRYDVVYTTSYPESAHLPGFLLRLLGVPWVVDYRYGGPLWVKKLVGFQKAPWRERLDLAFQRAAMRRAERVITQSEPMRDDFCRVFGLAPDTVDVIPSGYDDADFQVAPVETPFDRREGEVHLLHVGVMEGISPPERRQLIDALNRLAEGLADRGRTLVVDAVGRHLFDERERTTLRFPYRYHGVVVHRHLAPYLLLADCHLVSTITTNAGSDDVRGFIPGKVWEYLRAGQPILMVGPKDVVWSIIDEAGVGLHVGLGDEPPLEAETLLGALASPRRLHPKVRSYSWEARAHSLQAVFLSVTQAARLASRGGQARA